MKKLIVILIAMFQFLPSGSTQEYTKWELPEGATARLGTGDTTGKLYSLQIAQL